MPSKPWGLFRRILSFLILKGGVWKHASIPTAPHPTVTWPCWGSATFSFLVGRSTSTDWYLSESTTASKSPLTMPSQSSKLATSRASWNSTLFWRSISWRTNSSRKIWRSTTLGMNENYLYKISHFYQGAQLHKVHKHVFFRHLSADSNSSSENHFFRNSLSKLIQG